MKFNKSAESDFWYVEQELSGRCLGKVQKSIYGFYVFLPNQGYGFGEKECLDLNKFIKNINKQLGIYTTSAFTSIEDR